MLRVIRWTAIVCWATGYLSPLALAAAWPQGGGPNLGPKAGVQAHPADFAHSSWAFRRLREPVLSPRVLAQVFALKSSYFTPRTYNVTLAGSRWKVVESEEGKVLREAWVDGHAYMLDMKNGPILIVPYERLGPVFAAHAVLAEAPYLESIGIEFGNVVLRVGSPPRMLPEGGLVVSSNGADEGNPHDMVARARSMAPRRILSWTRVGGLNIPSELESLVYETAAKKRDTQGRPLFRERLVLLRASFEVIQDIDRYDPDPGRIVADYRASLASEDHVDYQVPASPEKQYSVLAQHLQHASNARNTDPSGKWWSIALFAALGGFLGWCVAKPRRANA